MNRVRSFLTSNVILTKVKNESNVLGGGRNTLTLLCWHKCAHPEIKPS